jgi:hypothetical protein
MSSEALCAKLGIPAGIPCGTHADLVRNLWLPSRAWCFLTLPPPFRAVASTAGWVAGLYFPTPCFPPQLKFSMLEAWDSHEIPLGFPCDFRASALRGSLSAFMMLHHGLFRPLSISLAGSLCSAQS